MSDEELRAALRRFFDEVWNKGNVSRDVSRMVLRVAKAVGIPRHISPHSLRPQR